MISNLSRTQLIIFATIVIGFYVAVFGILFSYGFIGEEMSFLFQIVVAMMSTGVLAVLITALAYTQLSKPRNYEDCILQVVKDAQSDRSATYGRQACRKKFPKTTVRTNSLRLIFELGQKIMV